MQDSTQTKNQASIVHTTKDASHVWQKVQAELRQKLGERVHMSWTGQLKLQLQSDNFITLTTPSQFVAGRIDNKYGDLVRSLWRTHDDRRIDICAETAIRKTHLSTPLKQSALREEAQTKPATALLVMQENTALAPDNLQQQPTAFRKANHKAVTKDRFTFENFVVGPSNELAYAIAKRVSTNTECQYNPIILHGPHGLGKTHLLNSIKIEALKTNPNRQVCLITAEDFVASFIQSVRAQGRSQINAFKSRLRDVDLLIIDDAHFIADKPGSQEELLHTLISLVDAGKQVLLATDRHPHKIDRASERLKSYLCGGLICDIGPCDYELRIRILDRLIERHRENGHPRLAMPQNARDHLAARINATPRDLEGALNQVLARSEFLGTALTLSNVQEALTHSQYTGAARPTVDKIQRATCKEFGLRMEELLSKRRTRAIARPRQVAMYLCKSLTKRSLPDIGRRFGGRDHTTVIHAVKRIDILRKKDPALNASLQNLEDELGT